jgi:hypothetical protein
MPQRSIRNGAHNNEKQIMIYENQTFQKYGKALVKVGYQLLFFMASVVVSQSLYRSELCWAMSEILCGSFFSISTWGINIWFCNIV